MKALSKPRFSVVIPAYYSFSTIRSTLSALSEQACESYEVIVVNSSPEEKTEEIVREFPGTRFIQSPVRLLPHGARNAGIARARGDFIVFTDPDCIADREWLSLLDAAFEKGHRVLVGAMGLAGDSWLEVGIHLSKFHWLLPGLKPGVRTCAPTANAAYSRDLLEETGLFPGEVFAGDGILSRRAASLGHPPVFVPEAVVHHTHDEGIASFFRTRFSRGKEYAWVRMKIMGPATPGTFISLALSPAAVILVILRAGKNASAAGWIGRFFYTLPIQIAGHLAWALGESIGAAEIMLGRKRFRGSRC